jgi:ribosomal protein L10
LLTLREESKLRVFKNRVLRRILDSKREEVTGGLKNYKVRNLVIGILHQMLLG